MLGRFNHNSAYIILLSLFLSFAGMNWTEWKKNKNGSIHIRNYYHFHLVIAVRVLALRGRTLELWQLEDIHFTSDLVFFFSKCLCVHTEQYSILVMAMKFHPKSLGQNMILAVMHASDCAPIRPQWCRRIYTVKERKNANSDSCESYGCAVMELFLWSHHWWTVHCARLCNEL